MKLTKIVATIGPSCESEKQIKELIALGVDLFRFNFKHNTVEWHAQMIGRVKKVASQQKKPVGTLIDLQGPEIRLKLLRKEIKLKKGEKVLFGEDIFKNKEEGISLTHPEVVEHLENGQKILADDGRFSFIVKKEKSKHYLISENFGVLGNKKSINIPGAHFPVDVLVERDLQGINLAFKHKIDYVALSFVRSAEDIRYLRKQLERAGASSKIITKVETKKATQNLDEVIMSSDVVMVARGDLGVELPPEQVPYFQKLIIKKCIENTIPVITATEMLQTMIESPRATRAEISDVANATYDLTDSVMLSAETAVGKYPAEAVRVMAKTVEFNEKKLETDTRLNFEFKTESKTELLADTAYNLYLKSKKTNQISAFVVFTKTGGTAKILSRYRPSAPIYAVIPNQTVSGRLSLSFGVYPILSVARVFKSQVKREDIEEAVKGIKKEATLKGGQSVIVLHGDYWEVEGGASTIRLVQT